MNRRILVTQAVPGMALGRPVVLADNLVLVGEGAVLTDAMLLQMLKRGVRHVVVRGGTSAPTSTGEFTNRRAALDTRFSRVTHIPLMVALRDVVARNIAKRI